MKTVQLKYKGEVIEISGEEKAVSGILGILVWYNAIMKSLKVITFDYIKQQLENVKT